MEPHCAIGREQLPEPTGVEQFPATADFCQVPPPRSHAHIRFSFAHEKLGIRALGRDCQLGVLAGERDGEISDPEECRALQPALLTGGSGGEQRLWVLSGLGGQD